MAARLDTNSQAIDFLRYEKIIDFVARTSGDKDNTIIFSTDKESTPNENLEAFEKIVNMTTGAYFIVERGARGTHRIEVKNEKVLQPTNNATPAVQGVPIDEVERRINAAIEGLKKEQRMEALELENKELKEAVKEHDSIINKTIVQLQPYIGSLISSLFSKLTPSAPAIQMAGIERIETDDEPDDEPVETSTAETINADQQRIVAALEKWAAADPDFISLLEVIADMAASKDPTYNMAKGFLKK